MKTKNIRGNVYMSEKLCTFDSQKLVNHETFESITDVSNVAFAAK